MSQQSAGDKLTAKITEVMEAVTTATTLSALESLRVAHLGRKGHLTLQLKQIGSLPVNERKAYGKALNIAKQKLQKAPEIISANLKKLTLSVYSIAVFGFVQK